MQNIANEKLELENLSETSISIIINPVIGLSILKSLYPPLTGERVTRSTSSYSNKGPKGVWFQPGAESDEIRAYVREMGLEGRVVCAGNHECILVEGDRLLGNRKVGGKL
ncbi:MAG: hypothetical protein EOP45_20495 [Sphingobacteriaceae bacterium]|nr:MAG: hypothetical protein EOP45_20495 [Sphingobacteriaceae bacterium]